MNHHRLLFASIQLSLVCASGLAFAQSDPAGTPGESASSGEYVPPADPTMTEVRPGPTGPSCSWSPRPCVYPHLVLSLDGGVSHLVEGTPVGFSSGTGSVTSTGPAWGARVGAEILPWFAVEAHYIGMSNRADASVSVGGRRGLLTNAAVLEARFTVPIRYVRPYLFIGGGIYSTSVTGSSTSTELTGSTEFGMPVGIGVEAPVTPGLSLGAEATYHRFFGESFSANEDIAGADPVTANAVVRFRL